MFDPCRPHVVFDVISDYCGHQEVWISAHEKKRNVPRIGLSLSLTSCSSGSFPSIRHRRTCFCARSPGPVAKKTVSWKAVFKASDRVDLKQSAVVTGDIAAQRISIDEGACFKGCVNIQREVPKKEVPRAAAS